MASTNNLDQVKTDQQVEDLEGAFQLFSQLSEQLESSYQELQEQVEQLTGELAAARSERLQYLEEKEWLANSLEKLLNVLPGGVVVLDDNGMISNINPAAAKLLGKDIVEKQWQQVIEKEFIANIGGQEVITRAQRNLVISSSSLGEKQGTITLLNDVTEANHLRESLDHHKRLSAMGEMAASLAHQVRTPLSAALLYTSQLEQSKLDDESRIKFSGKVSSRLRHLEGLITDMLLFAKGGSSSDDELDLVDLLQTLKSVTEQQLQKNGCDLRLASDILDGKLLNKMIVGSRDSLLTALQNLVNNAIDACGTGGIINVAVYPEGQDMVDVTVSDNGPGISEESLEKIFDPFFTSRSKGTGLGLAVVQAVADAHGGTAWVESELGEGAIFGIRLPIHGAKNMPTSLRNPEKI